MPSLIEIVSDHLRVTPKRDGHTYRFGCPNCAEGKDRLVVWPHDLRKPTGTFFCRRCRISGDGIDYCRRFLGMTYPQACSLLGTLPKDHRNFTAYTQPNKPAFPTINPPNQLWQERGKILLEGLCRNLQNSLHAKALLTARGITQDTARRYSIGYNSADCWESREAWGMVKEWKETGAERKIWLPKGLVIPRFDCRERGLSGLKIRREGWKKDDKYPKYVEVCGSANNMGIYGNPIHKVAIVVESELDAILIQQEAGDLCICISLGGAGGKRLDKSTHSLLNKCSLILISVDYDDAGDAELKWWRKIFPDARHWPPPIAKSPGDAHVQGEDLHLWVEAALYEYNILVHQIEVQ